jgi:hypothetical protein
MIDWLHEECITWGRQIRWLYLGRDGWPSRSVIGKLREEGMLGASFSRFTQHWPEVLNPVALKVNNGYKQLAEPDREILFIHYVVIGKGKVKAHRLGLPKSTYYDRVDAAQRRLCAAMTGPDKIVPFSPGQNEADTLYVRVA